MVRWVLLALALMVPTPLLAGQKPASIAITPQAAKGAVLLASKPLAVEYLLLISPYDPVEQRVALSGGQSIEVRQGRGGGPGGDYFMIDLKPGIYVVSMVTQQGIWGLCYANDTRQFRVGAGEVSFIGRFDSETALGELMQMAISNRHTSAQQGELHHYVEGVSPLPLAGAEDAAALASISDWMKTSSPKTSVTPVAATLQPARFGLSRTLLGGRACVSWFNEKAKSPSPP